MVILAGSKYGAIMWRFDGLLALYKNKALMEAAHLWDGGAGAYNIAYVHRMLASIPAILINLATRTQGFYVHVGNFSLVQYNYENHYAHIIS